RDKRLSRLRAAARTRAGGSDEKKGRLTLQAAQVWEERDGRTDVAHRTTSFANASSKFKCRPLAHLLAGGFLRRNPDFVHPSSANRETSHARAIGPADYLRPAASTARRS